MSLQKLIVFAAAASICLLVITFVERTSDIALKKKPLKRHYIAAILSKSQNAKDKVLKTLYSEKSSFTRSLSRASPLDTKETVDGGPERSRTLKH